MKPAQSMEETVVFRNGDRELTVISENGYFGITISNESPAIVDSVKPNGPADNAGLRKGDKILLVNDTDVTGMTHKAVVELIKSHANVRLRVCSTLSSSQVMNKRPSVSQEDNSSLPDSTKATLGPSIAPTLVKSASQHSDHGSHDSADTVTAGSIFKSVKRWSTFHGPRNDADKKQNKKGKKEQSRNKTQVFTQDLISAPVAVNSQENTKLSTLQQYYETLKASPSNDPNLVNQLKKIELEIAKIQSSSPAVRPNTIGSSTSVTSLGRDEELNRNSRISGFSVADDVDEEAEMVFESVEGLQGKIRSRFDSSEPISTVDTNGQFLLPSPKVRVSASLNDLAEEASLLSNDSPKVDDERQLDERSMRSASSGVICGGIDSSQHSGAGSATAPLENSTTKPNSRLMKLKKRSISSDDVHMQYRNDQAISSAAEHHLDDNETEDGEDLQEDAGIPKPHDETLTGDDFIASLSNPHGQTRQSQLDRPENLGIINFDASDDEAPINVSQPKLPYQAGLILPMESPNDHESEEVKEHQLLASFANHQAFQNVTELIRYPSYCIVVLKYLYTKGTQSDLLFYVLSNKYFDPRIVHPKGNDGNREKLSWAVELHSTFTAANAPWPISDLKTIEADRSIADLSFRNGNMSPQIDHFFHQARVLAGQKINEELAGFREAINQGFGAHFGVNALHQVTSVDQLVDEIWLNELEKMRKAEGDRSRVLLSAFSTVFSMFHCKPAFHDRWNGKLFCEYLRKFKKPETKKAKGHTCTELVYQSYPHSCAGCQKLLFGPNYQGTRCEGCNLDFHESCLMTVNSECVKKRGKMTFSKNSGSKLMNEMTQQLTIDAANNERGASPDNDHPGMPSPQPASVWSSGLESLLSPSDEDLADDPNEGDPLTCVHRSQSRSSMSEREQRRQCAIHELWRIQLYHVHKLRLLHDQVVLRIQNADAGWADAMQKLFPNLPRLIQEHSHFYNALKARHSQQCPFQTVGDILLDLASDERHKAFVSAVSECLEAHAEYNKLWDKLRAERRFAEYLAEIERAPRLLRRRRQVESLKVAEMQLIARYPLLIDGIIKYSDDEVELANLREAKLKFSQLPEEVNNRVARVEKRMQRKDLLDNLVISDREKFLSVFDFLQSPWTKLGELVHCGELTWKLPGLDSNVRAYLFASGVILLCVKRGSTYELKMHQLQAGPVNTDQLGSSFYPNKFVNSVDFCPVIVISEKTTINGTRDSSFKERIEIKPDKHEVKLGLSNIYRFTFPGSGPRDAIVEWDEWTHYLKQIQNKEPITRFKQASKLAQSLHHSSSNASGNGPISNNSVVNPTSPQPVVGNSQNLEEPSQLLPSSSTVVDGLVGSPDSLPPQEHEDAQLADESELSGDQHRLSGNFSEASIDVDAKETGLQNNSFFSTNGVGNSGEGGRQADVSSWPSQQQTDLLLTPDFARMFGFSDAKEMMQVGNFLLQKPVQAHSPVTRTISPKLSYPTIGALMSPKPPTELHEHLLCLSLEFNKLLALTSSAAASAGHGTPINANRVSFSAGYQPQQNGENVDSASSLFADQTDQLTRAIHRRFEAMLHLSASKVRSNTIASVNQGNDAVPL